MQVHADKSEIRERLRSFDFPGLFTQVIGWDRHQQELDIEADGYTYKFSAVAHKRGVQAFVCSPDADGSIPGRGTRQKLDTKLRKDAYEHIIIFTDSAKQNQLWQWVMRQPGQKRPRSLLYSEQRTNEALVQSLIKLCSQLSDEDTIGLTGVLAKIADAFDRDKVTKRFYDNFKKERDGFEKFVSGIPAGEMKRWYVSVMLNRLMFIYFIEKKGLLDNGDQNYLRHKLEFSRHQLGKDRFYRDFLCPLFFQGFALPESDRDAKIREVLGQVPYLDGGLFMEHEVERICGRGIDIKDKAFEALFAFFDRYKWHLHETAIKHDNEINPEVLGYVYEKYINQKQMGAYYTKEDITGYISQNTVLPFLFDRVKAKCEVAFEPDGPVWKLLREDPDRYIYEAVRTGVITEDGQVVPESRLPGFVRKGMKDPKARMFEQRYNLGLADPELALPTETWREYVERRKRCLELREKLRRGEVHEINDLITYNLNIRQFATDVIQQAAGSELIRAFWEALNGKVPEAVGGHEEYGITVLDPTVGSGAFLFAALNVLYPLYEGCLDRMEEYLAEKRALKKDLKGDLREFAKVVERISDHPNREYFILKSIIVDNLYGVDIMDEATEICKLRLFLKLVAQIDDLKHIEPLPDIDFNIRAGNTLVGFANREQVEKAVTSKLAFEDYLTPIESKAKEADARFKRYRWLQVTTGVGGAELRDAKQELQESLQGLRTELDAHLAQQYSINPKDAKAFAAWKQSHKPFHWWSEFYGIISRGGFDVIIGNPPYVEYTPMAVNYSVIPSYKTKGCGNLYAYVMEQCCILLSQDGRFSFIVPAASCCTPRMDTSFEVITERYGDVWTSLYDERPGKLFNGVDQQLAIQVGAGSGPAKRLHITNMKHWYSEAAEDERSRLFQVIAYVAIPATTKYAGVYPKIGKSHEKEMMLALSSTEEMRFGDLIGKRPTATLYYKNAGGRYWRIAKSFPTKFLSERGNKSTTTEATTGIHKPALGLSIAILSSSTFYWYWRVVSNCRHLTSRELSWYPVKATMLLPQNLKQFDEFTTQYESILKDTKTTLVTENVRSGRIEQHEYHASNAKPVIDQIDQVLAKHYGFTDEELDFIINYDIKYRMGRDALIPFEEQRP